MSPSVLNAQEPREFASEIKFPLDPAMAVLVRAWARERLQPDPNARGLQGDTYEIASLYFDTAQLDVFHRRGRHKYSKLRIRRYGGGALFLERKLKRRGQLTKQRTPVVAPELAQVVVVPAAGAWPGDWFARKVARHGLRPVCQIAYDRTARVQATPAGPIRLTLDENIRALPVDGPVFSPGDAAIPVTDRVVLELKFRRELPALFRELLEKFGLHPRPFSKYRTAVGVLGLVPRTGSPLICPTS